MGRPGSQLAEPGNVGYGGNKRRTDEPPDAHAGNLLPVSVSGHDTGHCEKCAPYKRIAGHDRGRGLLSDRPWFSDGRGFSPRGKRKVYA